MWYQFFLILCVFVSCIKTEASTQEFSQRVQRAVQVARALRQNVAREPQRAKLLNAVLDRLQQPPVSIPVLPPVSNVHKSPIRPKPKAPEPKLPRNPVAPNPHSSPRAKAETQLTFKQIPVLQQATAKRIPAEFAYPEIFDSEKGGNCAYHAVKNVAECMDLFGGDPCVVPDFSILQDEMTYINFLRDAIPIIQQLRAYKLELRARHARSYGDEELLQTLTLLDGDEVQNLINALDREQEIFVVEYIPQMDYHTVFLQAVLDLVLGQRSMLGMIWNDGTQDKVGQIKGAHWYGFVAVNCAGAIRLYVTDSAINPNANFAHVRDLLSCSARNLMDRIVRQAM
jgi:hypothetical protein